MFVLLLLLVVLLLLLLVVVVARFYTNPTPLKQRRDKPSRSQAEAA